MPYYPVSEPEMRSLSQDEGFITLFSSLATFCAGVWVTVWVSENVVPTSVVAPALLDKVVQPSLLLLVGLFLALTVWCFIQRQTTLGRIKQESKSVEVKT